MKQTRVSACVEIRSNLGVNPFTVGSNCAMRNSSSALLLNFTDSFVFWQNLLAECQTAWIRMRRRVTRRLIRIQAVFTWLKPRGRAVKGFTRFKLFGG